MTDRMKQTAWNMIPNHLRIKIKKAAESEHVDPFKMVKILLARAIAKSERRLRNG